MNPSPPKAEQPASTWLRRVVSEGASKSVRFAGMVGMVLAVAAPANCAEEGMLIARDGKAQASIVIPDNAEKPIARLADFIRYYVKESTGAELPVVGESAKPPQGKSIELICSLRGNRYRLTFPDSQNDAFHIHFPHPNTVSLVGKDEISLELAAFAFLERYLGIRWLFAGEKWEIVPKHQALVLSRKDIQESSVFFSRCLSLGKGIPYRGNMENVRQKAFRTERQLDFAGQMQRFCYYNKLVSRLEFHHNLFKLFPPAEYVEKMPEVFPIINGVRHLPAKDERESRLGWQPCMTNPKVVQEAIHNIGKALESDPHARTYSLGPNDGGGFCTCENCAKFVDAEALEQGKADFSKLYFQWAQKVIAGVKEKHPKAVFGTLSYGQAMEVPKGITGDPSLNILITNDSMTWVDSKRKQQMLRMIQDWRNAGMAVGWYDYVYGSQYLIPRIYNRLFAENIGILSKSGVGSFYAESYGPEDPSEGPKIYLICRLLWNPELDAGKTLDEWYRLAVGEKAAPYLRQYYDALEEFWTREVPKTPWFTDRLKVTKTFLSFASNRYMDALTQERVNGLLATMKKVTELAETPEQKSRALELYATTERIKTAHANYRTVAVHLDQIGSKNTIYSDSFDKTGSLWPVWERVKNKCNWKLDPSEGRLAKGAMKLGYVSAAGNAAFQKNFKIAPHVNAFLVKGWLMSDGFQDANATVNVQANFKDKDGFFHGTQFARGETITEHEDKSWKAFEFAIGVPSVGGERPDTLSLTIGVRGQASGTLWVDDVEISEINLKKNQK